MKIKFRHIIGLITIASIISIGYGFYIMEEVPDKAHKFIGFGTVGLFLIAMPLFLISASKGKKVKDYMLTEENIRKMRGTKKKEAENQ